jgi:hypothetical protein
MVTNIVNEMNRYNVLYKNKIVAVVELQRSIIFPDLLGMNFLCNDVLT